MSWMYHGCACALGMHVLLRVSKYVCTLVMYMPWLHQCKMQENVDIRCTYRSRPQAAHCVAAPSPFMSLLAAIQADGHTLVAPAHEVSGRRR
jgi:hypothetical protein